MAAGELKMAFRDILLALTTYPDPTPTSAVDEAVAFAAAVGARISAIACKVHYHVPPNILGGVLLDVPAMAAGEANRSSTNAEKLLLAFQEAAEKNRVLTIVPVPEGDSLQHSYAESIIFGSGRPTLIMPDSRKRAGHFELNTVVVAWDFSRPAARAVADALPLLKKAKQVRVVTVTNEKIIDTTRSGEEVAKYLARHGVQVVLDNVDAAGRRIGDVLESSAASRNADLIVMGAYGHSRVRDFILGGATKSMLSRPPVPVFLSH
jgi:nucleotide-binding universal stress UspA family protein